MWEPSLDGVGVWLWVDGDAEGVLPDVSRSNTGLCLCAAWADHEDVLTVWLWTSPVDTLGAEWVCAVDALVDVEELEVMPLPVATDAV